jgi:para-nitrobenzyl esterase
MIKLFCLLVVLFAAAMAGIREVPLTAQSNDCFIQTQSGAVHGSLRGGVCAYIGVPYAAAPTGDLRWRPPQPRAPWAPATYEANVLRQCPQLNQATGATQGQEDCLFLNVWAPAAVRSGRGRSVLVWLHTGSFQAATANFAANDGVRFAETRDAIVVAPNYRLGPLGFLAHPALAAENPHYPASGNYGIADQRAALRWVRANIASFGGDPDNVTLAGTSAGAHSTSMHLVSPSSRGLFHRAILQSGNGTSRADTSLEAEDKGEAFAAAIGCTDPARVLSCLRTATFDRVLRALPVGQAQILEGGRVEWKPSVDGLEIPDQPRELYRRGLFARVPVVIGTQGDEGWAYVDRSFPAGLDANQYDRVVRTEFGMDANDILRLYPAAAFPTPKDALARLTGDVEYVCEARRIARVMHHDGAPVYLYSFEYSLAEIALGRAVHGLESNLLFGNNFAVTPNLGITAPRALNAADLLLFEVMSALWRYFMERGDPNPPGAPVRWPLYRPGDNYFVLSDRLGAAMSLRDQQCNFWEPFFFRSVIGAVPAVAR